MDISFFYWINSLAGLNPTLDLFMIWVAKYSPAIFIGVLVILWFSKNIKFQRGAFLAGVSAIVALGIGQVIGLIIQRQRPYYVIPTHMLIARTLDTSFPSDHATFAFAIAASLWQVNRRLSIALLLLSTVLGLARVFVGAHYPLDILGGAVLGIGVSAGLSWLKDRNPVHRALEALFGVLAHYHLAAGSS
jgi:undecaprenyl-diphosphatase